MDLMQLTTWLGWMSLINMTILCVAGLMLYLGRQTVFKLQRRLIPISQEEMVRLYAEFLARYKMWVILLNIAPYLALKLMV